MKRLLSLLSSGDILKTFRDRTDFVAWLEKYDLDGVELVYYNEDLGDIIPDPCIVGVHLPFYADWYDYWMGKTGDLDREFGGRSVWQQFYPGPDRRDFLKFFIRPLEFAHRKQAEYVVFHVSQVSLAETFHGRARYPDAAVIDTAADLINQILDPDSPLRSPDLAGVPFEFDFLMENLWWSGLNYRRPEDTRRLLEQVRTPRKGLLLDTGHFLCTDPTLRTEADAVRHLSGLLDSHNSLLPAFRGIHLHQSLSGAYVERMRCQPVPLHGDYYERFAQSYRHVFQIDRHEVMRLPGLGPFIRSIDPRYMVYEFRYQSRRACEQKLKAQNRLARSWAQASASPEIV